MRGKKNTIRVWTLLGGLNWMSGERHVYQSYTQWEKIKYEKEKKKMK